MTGNHQKSANNAPRTGIDDRLSWEILYHAVDIARLSHQYVRKYHVLWNFFVFLLDNIAKQTAEFYSIILQKTDLRKSNLQIIKRYVTL
jgi:hypothetical protein